jgi:hypothetical protein
MVWRSVGGRIGCLLDSKITHLGAFEYGPVDPRTLLAPADRDRMAAGSGRLG